MGHSEHVTHGFGPCWDVESRVLVLGSMPSPKSRQASFYYMHPRNRFWPVMGAIFRSGDDDGPGTTADSRKAFALRHHVALWDVIASCDIVGASDASIRNAVPNDLAMVVRAARIVHVFTTGTQAGRLYRRLCEPMLRGAGIDLPMTQLPSTSPANAAMRLDDLIDRYRCIADAAAAAGR